MSEMPMQNSWPELYREALLEPDPTKVPARIEEAQKAICRRALELWYAGSPATKELHDLDTALHFLDLLRIVGAVELELSQEKYIDKRAHGEPRHSANRSMFD